VYPHRAIVEVVLGVHSPRSRRDVVIAALVGVGAYGLLGLWALRPERRPEPARETGTTRVPVEISLDETVVRIRPSGTPFPRPKMAPAPRGASVPNASSRSGAHSAQAATIVAQEPTAPIDLTGETFVVGGARAYGGGVTSPHGTSAVPVQGSDAVARSASGEGAALPGRSVPVGLASQSWSCPWPSEADPLPIDEEIVVIRVVVRPDGTAESVAVVSDPGHGFGDAAARCAMRTRFTPALGPNGELVRATSSPIRVRFTR